MTGLRAVMYREYKLLIKDRVNLLLGIVPPVVYVLLFATSMSRLLPDLDYGSERVAYVDFLLPAIMLTSMIGAATTSATSLFQEELQGVTLQIWSHPLSKASFIVGRLSATTGLVLLQGIAMLATAAIVFGRTWPLLNILALLLAALCASASVNMLYLFVASRFRDQRRFMIAIGVAAPVLTFGSPSFYPYESMPRVLQFVSWFNPVAYGVEAVRGSLLVGVERAMWPSLVLVGLALSTGYLAARSLLLRFREL